ncbi:MAG: DUF2029 domain-containing protein [Saccharofermentans sp.]|nr:DUF2029 domain-containing protein [Saccharofermentans sp.]
MILTYTGLVFIAPKVPIWNRNTTYEPENSTAIDIEEGQTFEYSISIPYDYINTIEVLFINADDARSVIIPFDAQLELIDSNGNTIIRKEMTSIYDVKAGSGYTPVHRDSSYTIRFTVNHIDAPEEVSLPQLQVSPSGEFSTAISGRYNGAPSKELFSLIYLLFSASIILYVYSLTKRTQQLIDLSEKILLAVICAASITLLSQVYDLLMIIKGALKIIETVKIGAPLSYYDYCYSTSLISGESILLLSHNLDFFMLLPVSVILLPFSFFIDSNANYNTAYALTFILLTSIVFVLILASGRIISKICRECQTGSEYEQEVKRFFVFSPFLLSVTIVFGQIDMFYIILIIAGMLMYFRGNLKAFTAFMSFAIAMKTLPFMIFFVLLLLVRKKPVTIIAYSLAAMIPSALSIVLFKHGIGYDAIMDMVYHEYDFVGMLFNSTVGDNNAVFPICFALILIYAYLHSEHFENKKEHLRTSMTLVFATYASFAAFTEWHSQWLIPLVLSLAFLVPLYKNNKGVMLIGVVAEILLILVSYGNKAWSMYMTNFTLPMITGYNYNGPTLTGVYNNAGAWCFTLLSSLLAALLIALCYIFFKNVPAKEPEVNGVFTARQTACLRIVSLYALTTLFFWCYWYVG